MAQRKGTKKPPAFQLYAKDMYAETSALSPEEFTAHFRGLFWSWENGPLPRDLKRRARLLMTTPTKLAVIWAGIAHLWEETESGYINVRHEEYRQGLESFRLSQAEKGRLGGLAKARNRLGHGQPSGQLPARDQPVARDRPVDGSAACNLLLDQEQDQPSAAPDERIEPLPSIPVLTRLAHDVLDDVAVGRVSSLDQTEELKTRAARARLSYDCESIWKALDSCEFQRSRWRKKE